VAESVTMTSSTASMVFLYHSRERCCDCEASSNATSSSSAFWQFVSGPQNIHVRLMHIDDVICILHCCLVWWR